MARTNLTGVEPADRPIRGRRTRPGKTTIPASREAGLPVATRSLDHAVRNLARLRGESFFHELCLQLAAVLGVEHAWVAEVRHDGVAVRIAACCDDVPRGGTSTAYSPANLLIDEPGPVVIPFDAALRLPHCPALGALGADALACIGLWDGGGNLVGYMAAAGSRLTVSIREAEEALTSLGALAALEMERRGAESALVRAHRAQLTWSRLRAARTNAGDETQYMQAVCEAFVQVGGFRTAWAGILSGPGHKELAKVAWAGSSLGKLRDAPCSLSAEGSAANPLAAAMHTGRPALFDKPSAPADPLWRAAFGRHKLHGVLAIPLAATGRKPFGLLVLCADDRTRLDNEGIALASTQAKETAKVWNAVRRARLRRSDELRREAHLRAMVEHSTAVVVVVDPETGYIVDASRAATAFYGHSVEALRTMRIFDFADSPEGQVRTLLRHVLDEGLLTVDAKHRSATGEHRDAVLHLTSVNVRGRVLVCVLATDVTNDQDAAKALLEGEQRFRTMLGLSSAGIFVWRGAFIDCNEKMGAILGRPVEEVRGRRIEEVSPEFQPNGEKSSGAAADSFRRAKSGETVVGEWRFTRSDGKPVDCEVSLRAVTFNRAPAIIGEIRDITAAKRAANDAHRQNALLNAVSDAQSQFIASGDMRTVFENLLMTLLAATHSEYGFVAEVCDDERGAKVLRVLAYNGVGLDAPMQKLFGEESAKNLTFRDMRTLFGNAICTARPVISNSPKTDPRAKGLPAGHVPLNAFLGVPFLKGDEVVGMVAVANRPGGYEEEWLGYVTPVATTCGQILDAHRANQRRQAAEEQAAHRERWFGSLIENSSDPVAVVDSEGAITYVSPAVERAIGLSPRDLVGTRIVDLPGIQDPARAMRAAESAYRQPGLNPPFEFSMRHTNGELRHFEVIGNNRFDDPDICGIVLHCRDITERRLAEAERAESESRFASVFAGAAVGMATVSLSRAQFLETNRALQELLGYTAEEMRTKTWHELLVPEDRRIATLHHVAAMSGGNSPGERIRRMRRKDGAVVTCLLTVSVVQGANDKPAYFVYVVRDVSEQMAAAARLKRSEDRFATAFQSNPAAMLIARADNGLVIDANDSLLIQAQYAREDLVGQSVSMLKLVDRSTNCSLQACLAGNRPVKGVEAQLVTRQGHSRDVLVSVEPIELEDGPCQLVMLFDYTERRQMEEHLQHQLRRLAALREVDLAINASLDLRLTLSVVLSSLTNQLDVDAADVLLVSPHSPHLEQVASTGFQNPRKPGAQIPLGDTVAGRAAMECRTIRCLPSQDSTQRHLAERGVDDEGFVLYYAVPLVAKGQTRGVLEVFSRKPVQHDTDSLGFLGTMCSQAALVIDNVELFGKLQRSNAEMLLSYDATIEALVRALDLRDHETEGHTLRVTDMTVRLARAMGIDKSEIVHIRRGALLHDIGKMGISDSILLKPGPLTPEERAVMQTHTDLAREMLQPISFIKPALPIPYHHHEKWDGTGYPVGLREYQIPLEARIFAVVDVWDAMRSDRPYRKGLPLDEVIAFIRQESGRHFDPEVVAAFLKLLAEGEEGRPA